MMGPLCFHSCVPFFPARVLVMCHLKTLFSQFFHQQALDDLYENDEETMEGEDEVKLGQGEGRLDEGHNGQTEEE